MVVLLDLDDEGRDPYNHGTESTYAVSKLCLKRNVINERSTSSDLSLSTSSSSTRSYEEGDAPGQSNSNASHLFSKALACYPFVSLLRRSFDPHYQQLNPS